MQQSLFICLFSESVEEGRKSLPGFGEVLCCSSISWSGLALGGTDDLLWPGDSADRRNLGFYTTRWKSG